MIIKMEKETVIKFIKEIDKDNERLQREIKTLSRLLEYNTDIIYENKGEKEELIKWLKEEIEDFKDSDNEYFKGQVMAYRNVLERLI